MAQASEQVMPFARADYNQCTARCLRCMLVVTSMPLTRQPFVSMSTMQSAIIAALDKACLFSEMDQVQSDALSCLFQVQSDAQLPIQ